MIPAVNRAWKAAILGGTFVALLELLGHHRMATPLPFWLLSPGILAGAFVPDSGFNPEGDIHPWGPVSTFVLYAVNVAIYTGLAYLVLYFVAEKPADAPR
jgi:hypothetical protein